MAALQTLCKFISGLSYNLSIHCHAGDDDAAIGGDTPDRNFGAGGGAVFDCDGTGLDMEGWVDSAGDTCAQYAANGWCCSPQHQHCNVDYSVNGVDSDRACCASCSHERTGICSSHRLWLSLFCPP